MYLELHSIVALLSEFACMCLLHESAPSGTVCCLLFIYLCSDLSTESTVVLIEGTRLERAATAEKNQNADSKRDEAIAYVRKQKENAAARVSTLCEDTASMAYVIYRVEANNNEGFCSGLIAWANPLDHTSHNTHAFCDIYDDGKNDDDDTINKNVNESVRQKVVHKKGIRLTTTIESGTSALFEAHFNLD
nr:hypothetical protein [Tanacetum cinerariifolium]